MEHPDTHLRLQQFPDSEVEKRKRLLALFSDWQAAMRETLSPENLGLADGFVWDGFYPYYFQQPLKILYVGRECLGLAGYDYLDEILPAYRGGGAIGSKPVNSSFYHARMLRMTHGILHGFKNWDDIPTAATIGDTFACAESISFAMMNLSKFSNESTDSYSADWNLIRLSVENSRDFIQREVELLEPDVVITMNIGTFLPRFGEVTKFNDVATEAFNGGRAVDAYILQSGQNRSLLLDAWHFSAPGKGHVKDFYEPICSAIQTAVKGGVVNAFTPRTER
jgi:hypothetical protein